MKETTKMSRTVATLEKMYNTLNVDKFENALPTPIITVQSKPGTYGHCSRFKIWRRKDDDAYELNIAAESLKEPIEEIIDTMIHEMVHLYCNQNGISDVSRYGTYHNKRFKEEAEKRGLKCKDAGKYGWNTQGKDNDSLIEYILEKGWTEFRIARETIGSGIRLGLGSASSGTTQTQTPGTKAPSSTRKYQCPECKNSVRATKDLKVICGDCMELMLKV